MNGSAAARLCVGAALVAGLLAGSPTRVVAAVARGGCVVQLTTWKFHPMQAAPGGSTRIEVVLQNCTDQAQTVSLTRFGSEPQPCPVLDPVAWQATIPASGTYFRAWPWTAPQCTGVEALTLRVSDPHSGKLLAEHTAHLTIESSS